MVYLPSQHTHSDQLLTGSKRGTKLVHTLVKDAGKEAAKAGAQEVSPPPTPFSLHTHFDSTYTYNHTCIHTNR
jgi:hypothetical protein